jgi:YHS domain-containing protein
MQSRSRGRIQGAFLKRRREMSRRIARRVSFGAALLLGATGFLYAHGPGKKSMDGMMKECQGHHAEAMRASDQVNVHLSEAKRSGTLADMRQHVESAEKAMTDMEKHMSLFMGCMMGGGMKSHGMTSGEKKTAGKVVDPVCGMTVDPVAAPSAMYKGKTYYFCSEDDKEKFEKSPEAYVKKPS